MEIVNFIAAPLKTGQLLYHCKVPWQGPPKNEDFRMLARIRGLYNSTTNKKGCLRTLNCFICCIYDKQYDVTNWIYRDYGMPLCKVARGCHQTYSKEHTYSQDEHISCGFSICTNIEFWLPGSLGKWNRTREGRAAERSNKRAVTISPPLAKQRRKKNTMTKGTWNK